jgi:hypothetical protein
LNDRKKAMRGHLWDRRELMGGAGEIALLGLCIGRARGAALPTTSVSDPVLSAILSAGNWSTLAEDNGRNERVNQGVASSWVKAAAGPAPSRQSIVDLGVLTLTLAVAEWGVEWQGAPPADPADKEWTGPKSIEAGKHLMSYALGGVGLPHLDAQDGIAFFDQLAGLMSGDTRLADYVRHLPADFHYDRVRAAGGMCDGHHAVIMTDIFGEPFHHDAVNFGGPSYCTRFNPSHLLQPDQWQAFRSWARLALRRRDMQRWIVDTWINRYWLPAYDLVIKHPHGSLGEAFVIARIWNSGQGLATAAISAAATSSDPNQRIQLELDNYCRRSPTYRSRRGVMQRPGEVYQQLIKSI